MPVSACVCAETSCKREDVWTERKKYSMVVCTKPKNMEAEGIQEEGRRGEKRGRDELLLIHPLSDTFIPTIQESH